MGCPQPMAAIAGVFFWWFGYGFYFSQNPGRPQDR